MPARFTILLTPSFRRDLERLPAPTQKQVLEAIKVLESHPKGPLPKIKKLKGKGIGQWRLEVSACRVRYDVLGDEVVLYRVRHRKDIYRD